MASYGHFDRHQKHPGFYFPIAANADDERSVPLAFARFSTSFKTLRRSRRRDFPAHRKTARSAVPAPGLRHYFLGKRECSRPKSGSRSPPSCPPRGEKGALPPRARPWMMELFLRAASQPKEQSGDQAVTGSEAIVCRWAVSGHSVAIGRTSTRVPKSRPGMPFAIAVASSRLSAVSSK
jgi:hypothetical protein